MNAPFHARSRRSYFAELAAGMMWSADARLVMLHGLWGYFDESGEHAKDSALRRLTMGGGIPTWEAWDALTDDWNIVLARFAVAAFHMADFDDGCPHSTSKTQTANAITNGTICFSILFSILSLSMWTSLPASWRIQDPVWPPLHLPMRTRPLSAKP